MPFDPKSVRAANLARLNQAGFKVAPSLPLSDPTPALRPIPEIARRLAALNALFIYVSAPESAYPAEPLLAYIRANNLQRDLTPDEAAMIELDRAAAGDEHGNAIGWRTENAVALAWILGIAEPPGFDGQMLDGPQIRPLVANPDPSPSTSVDRWAAALSPRSVDDVATMEDLFYCAHNAARSAQVQLMEARGRPVRRFESVPKDFDPIANTGVIHERRHALTWALSTDDWDETDLDT